MGNRFKGWNGKSVNRDILVKQPEYLPAKRSKYGNHKVHVGMEKFDSKRELNRWNQLLWRQSIGEISGLERQISYSLIVNGEKIADYICDFQYYENGMLVVEDAKGFRTPGYRLKKKLMWAIHNIKIKEV